jgi:hypothetical protein
MKRDEFTLRVKTLSNPSDYAENEHLLEVIDSLHFEHFLNCLKMGSRIKPSYRALDTLNELSNETALDSIQIMQLLPKFRLLIAFFDGRS